MNAVDHFAARLPPTAVRRLARLRLGRIAARAAGAQLRVHELDLETARARVIARWGDDLCGVLNALTHDELAALAVAVGVDASGRSPALRARLWERGAALERGDHEVARAVQPRPVVLGGHLVIEAPPRGAFPPATHYPRPIPPPRAPAPPADEPDDLDELLAAADRALGVRLGERGRDKGAWGTRAQALLGVRDRGAGGAAELAPDWRGDVELKTIAVARDGDADDPAARWRVVDDPAIAMVGDARPLAKLQRTLWLARVDLPDRDATLVSWYLLEWDAEVARLAHRYLHQRPKGPARTDARGFYLHKRFFADTGLLASLNGPA